MSKKILTRLSLFLLVLFGITILTFIYTNLSPVDAAEALAVRRYSRPTPEQVELVREELGLDKPLIQQYGSWLWNALHGDFGNSYNTGRPIIEELTASLGPTITMASLALLFAAIFSIPLGVLSASKKGGLFDKTVYLFGIVSMSLAQLLDWFYAPAGLFCSDSDLQHYGGRQHERFYSSGFGSGNPGCGR